MDHEFSKSGNLYAITVLKEFFDYYGIDKALSYTERLIYYATHDKYYRDAAPYVMLFHTEWLRKVAGAIFVLRSSFEYSNAFVVPAGADGFPDLARKADFMPEIPPQEWKCFPRYVTADQYLDPVKALLLFTDYKSESKWMKAMDELLEYSLSKAAIHACYPAYNMMKLRIVLLRGIEACHLMLVRYNLFKQGRQINTVQMETARNHSSQARQV